MSHELDLSYFNAVLDLVVGASTGNKIIVQKSTVPCGNALRVSKMVILAPVLCSYTLCLHFVQLQAKARPDSSFTVLSNPEFLNAGTAIKDLLAPYSIIIGSPSADPRSDPDTMSLLGLYSWIPDEKIRIVSNSSSELIKIANNAFEAQRISSINSLSTICENIGANVTEISHTLGMNPNIGPHFLRAGVGFGGSCLRKDTLGLSAIATNLGIPEVAEYWRQVVVINEFQINRFTKKVCDYASESSSRAVAILGFAFKKDTNDSRESIARDVILALLDREATVTVHDPLISANAIENLLPVTSKVRICQTPYEACRGAETIAILNESEEYTKLDWGRISVNMEGKKKVVVDGRNIVDDVMLETVGLVVKKLGKPT
jgi:UDPglucose 6-dehydrogenase